jgi:hypothetical protein
MNQNSTKRAPKMQQKQLGKREIGTRFREIGTMNILFNRLQATHRIQIYDGKKLQSKSHSPLSPSLPKALQNERAPPPTSKRVG